MPPEHWCGQADFMVVASARERSNGQEVLVKAAITATVIGLADAPELTVDGTAVGVEDSRIDLAVTLLRFPDTDASEEHSVEVWVLPHTVAGLLAGGVAMNGTVRDGWVKFGVPVGDVYNISLLPAPHWSGEISVTVVASSSSH